MAKNSERFQKIYTQGVISMMEIWVDTTTGVQYLFHKDGYAAGLTPLLGADGKPVISMQGPER
ncbi:MAG: xylan 1,4-beta-xylosidase [Angelakisella sp.]|jgi:hypothetical protein|nr:xylan 1,4-beta-xylosidase [Angelakisella sp.]